MVGFDGAFPFGALDGLFSGVKLAGFVSGRVFYFHPPLFFLHTKNNGTILSGLISTRKDPQGIVFFKASPTASRPIEADRAWLSNVNLWSSKCLT